MSDKIVGMLSPLTKPDLSVSVSSPQPDAESVASVLARIAEIASETLELQAVFERVAAAVRELIPFENMGVVRIIDDERAILHASTVPCKAGIECSGPIPLTSWSPRMRPRSGPNSRIEDAEKEFDPNFVMDARALEGGVRSALWEPFRSDALRGGVWLCSYRPHAYTDAHQEMLRPIAALLGSAVEHWRIWDVERRRLDRLAQLETLLAPLAESLDVRDVFTRISEAVQPVLPHHLLALTEIDEQKGLRVVTWAGESDGPDPDPEARLPLTHEELERRLWPYEIVRDMKSELAPVTERNKLLLATGMRSWLRVPVRQWGEVRGSLVLFHRDPGMYSEEDVEVMTRFADRIAVAQSHYRLAEEARTAAEAREHAERLQATVETLARALESRGLGRVIGVSRAWKDVLLQVGRVAKSETTVLITGESGTGKEVVSSLIHQGSARAGKPFVAINCAALPEQLLESELFGHEKGAFTGAVATKIGRIEQAAGGTLFLDEIAEMSPIVQAKFLRFLEQREFQRLGGTRTLKAEVRVIAATNRDLQAAIVKQSFREDLYYRLNVFTIPISPLRERPEDILPLAESFLEDLGRTMGRPAAGISRDARAWLLAHSWPGNVRELRNAIERAILLCDGGLITREHLPVTIRHEAKPGAALPNTDGLAFPPEGLDLAAMERGYLEKALDEAKGNKTKAARLLGLTRAQLYSRLEKHGVE